MTGSETSPRSWKDKFADAARGWRLGAGETSFRIHLLFAAGVAVAAIVLRCTWLDWCVLMLCVTVVLTAELLNTAIERLAKAVDARPNAHIGAALDIAAAAVLTSAIGAAATGLVVFVHRLTEWLSWWTSIGQGHLR